MCDQQDEIGRCDLTIELSNPRRRKRKRGKNVSLHSTKYFPFHFTKFKKKEKKGSERDWGGLRAGGRGESK